MKFELEFGGDSDGDFPLSREIVGEEIALAISPFLEGYEVVTAAVTCVSDDEMRRLNFRYRNLDESTDVLSFPLWEKDGEFLPPKGWRALPLGDVVISPEVVRRGAAEANIGYNNEMARMTVHGALHLVGFDHNDKDGAAAMWGLQEKTVGRIVLRVDNSGEE
jgi:probable rRNA maturation factor